MVAQAMPHDSIVYARARLHELCRRTPVRLSSDAGLTSWRSGMEPARSSDRSHRVQLSIRVSTSAPDTAKSASSPSSYCCSCEYMSWVASHLSRLVASADDALATWACMLSCSVYIYANRNRIPCSIRLAASCSSCKSSWNGDPTMRCCLLKLGLAAAELSVA